MRPALPGSAGSRILLDTSVLVAHLGATEPVWGLLDVLVRSVDFLVAAEAARIQAATRLGMPDAAILATGVLTTAHVLATNDRHLAVAASSVALHIDVLLLADVVG
jgi:predicted nucleic acid-binding protein